MPATRQQRVFYKTFSQHGSGTAMVEIEPKDVVLLIHIAYLDIFENEPDWFLEPFCQLAKESFYTITPEKVTELPMLTTRAGREMGKYIIKYIKPPISKMEEVRLPIPSNIRLSASEDCLTITDDSGNCYSVPRNEVDE